MKKCMLVLMMAGLLTMVGSGSLAAKKQYRVTLLVKNLVNPTWIAVKRGAEAASVKYGVKLTVLAPLRSENNEEQITQVEQAIAKREDAIVLIPADSKGIIPAVEKANEANIPVINVNTKVAAVGTAKTATFIAVENYDAACKVAHELAKQMKKKGKVIILEGKTGSQSAVDISKGAVDTFKKYPKIKVVAKQTAQWSRSEALSVTQNLLQAYPGVNAVFGSNDEMALGAVEAIDQAKKIGKILVAGLDANEDAVKAILLGRMHITCDKKSYDQGYYGVEYAVKILKKRKVANFIPVKTELITKDNINTYKVK
jgi:ribose transport system substrate-binding protein